MPTSQNRDMGHPILWLQPDVAALSSGSEKNEFLKQKKLDSNCDQYASSYGGY
jgi:hypothetical protein